MKLILIKAAKLIMSAIYALLKLLPTRRRVVFISRQSDEPSLDFIMLRDRLLEYDADLDIKFLCKTMPKRGLGLFLYCFEIIRQMYYLASSRLAVLDTYCIPVSVLRHKSQLRIIQLWHALGSFKKFGLSVAGKAEGSSNELVQAFAMHKNYDYIICSGERCRAPFSEAFGADIKRVLPLGLPRMELLSSGGKELRKRIFVEYPELDNGKRNILYVPTFRRANGQNDYRLEDSCATLKSAVELKKYNLIIKTHSGSELVCTTGSEREGHVFSGMELLFAADAAITDYSSIVFEAALAGVPIYLWCPDLDSYSCSRGFYLNFPDDIPSFCSKQLGDVLAAIDSDYRADEQQLERFIDEFAGAKNSTDRLAALCFEQIG